MIFESPKLLLKFNRLFRSKWSHTWFLVYRVLIFVLWSLLRLALSCSHRYLCWLVWRLLPWLNIRIYQYLIKRCLIFLFLLIIDFNRQNWWSLVKYKYDLLWLSIWIRWRRRYWPCLCFGVIHYWITIPLK